MYVCHMNESTNKEMKEVIVFGIGQDISPGGILKMLRN